jgi:hypothetical protein
MLADIDATARFISQDTADDGTFLNHHSISGGEIDQSGHSPEHDTPTDLATADELEPNSTN